MCQFSLEGETTQKSSTRIIWKMQNVLGAASNASFHRLLDFYKAALFQPWIALKRWTDGPHNAKTLCKCVENQSCCACSCRLNDGGSISVTRKSFWSYSIQSIPGKRNGLLSVLARSGMLWRDTGGSPPTPPSPAMLGMSDVGFSSRARQENNTNTKTTQTGHPGYTLTIHTHWVRGQ